MPNNDKINCKKVLTILLCVLLPPVAVLVKSESKHKLKNTLINLFCCFFFWLPAIVHAVYTCTGSKSSSDLGVFNNKNWGNINWDKVLMILMSIFLPPISVFIARNGACDLAVLLNIALCLLAWFPGVIHALYVQTRNDGYQSII